MLKVSIKLNHIQIFTLHLCFFVDYDVSPPISQFFETRQVDLDATLSSVAALPGACSVVRQFHDMHLPMAVATSSYAEAVKKKTSAHQGILFCFVVVLFLFVVSKEFGFISVVQNGSR